MSPKITTTKKTTKPKQPVAKPTEAELKVHEPEAVTKEAKKPSPKVKAAKAKDEKKTSALDAAARVLAESGEPMTTRELIDAMAAKKLWSSPNGLTPSATLYSALLREITTKKSESRFKKTERGKFALTNKG